MPTAVLRRYTPPTCTLEIAAAGSALSRWTDRTVLKNLRFYLSFDDPKLHPERQVSVSGDRNQLEGLYDVVSTYVQTLIALPPEQVQWDASTQVETAEEPQAQPVTPPTATGMSLEPQGLLSHHLNLGSLATAESGAIVHLTTLQLFDLANALEAYNADAVSLPTARTSWAKSQWASTAAVAVLALGITGVLAKFVLDISAPTVQTAAVPREKQVNSELNSELFPTLSPPPLEASPSITLQPLPPPLPGAAKTEAGLPPVGVTQPPVSSVQPQVAAPAPAGSLESSGSAGNSSQLDSSSLGSSSGSQQQITLIPSDSVASLPSTASESARSAEPPRLAEAGAPSAASTVPTDQIAANRSTAFDTIPQVAEIRNYFQQTWQPPEGVPQTLEYRLLLNADGSLQRIVPLGQAAETYIDRTNMPLMGETFVSPTSDGSTPQVRLVLKSNGTVQSFLEYAN